MALRRMKRVELDLTPTRELKLVFYPTPLAPSETHYQQSIVYRQYDHVHFLS